jgi:hypothetical protein
MRQHKTWTLHLKPTQKLAMNLMQINVNWLCSKELCTLVGYE